MEVQSWHYAPWDITITSNSQYHEEYCLNTNENWNCIHRLIIEPESSIQAVKLSQTEIYTNTAVFVIVIMLLLWLVKWIFRLIIPTKWRRD